MKTKLLLLTTFLSFAFTTSSFADCYSCSNTSQLNSYTSCNSCGNTSSDSCEYMNTCANSEPSCGKNPCLSARDCTHTYGNIGQLPVN